MARDVAGCVATDGGARPGLRGRRRRARRARGRRRAGSTQADRSSRARVEAAAALFRAPPPRRARRSPTAIAPAVHARGRRRPPRALRRARRALRREHRAQDRALPRGQRRRGGCGRSAASRVPRERARGARRASTCCDADARVRRAARRRRRDRGPRRRDPLTFPFNALGWPALALPCGPAEDGLPASVQLVGRPGDDGRVLAAGRLLELLLAVAARTAASYTGSRVKRSSSAERTSLGAGGSPGGSGTASPSSVHAEELLRRIVLERDVVAAEPRAQPAAQQPRLRRGAAHANRPARPRSPARASRAGSASATSAPRRCPRRPAREELGQPRVRGRADRPTRSSRRSAGRRSRRAARTPARPTAARRASAGRPAGRR